MRESNFKDLLNTLVKSVDESIENLKKHFLNFTNKGKTVPQNVKLVIVSIVAIYNHMNTLVPKDGFPDGFPPGNVVKNTLENAFSCLSLKKDSEVDSFFELLNWIKTMLKNLSLVLISKKESTKQLELLTEEIRSLKMADANLSEGVEDEPESILLEKYVYEKLDDTVNDIFSEFGERRWIFSIWGKDSNKHSNAIEMDSICSILLNQKWEQRGDIFVSPQPIEHGEESWQVERLLKTLKKSRLLSPVSHGILLYCTIGIIEPKSFSNEYTFEKFTQ
jgi:hypothetical protein